MKLRQTLVFALTCAAAMACGFYSDSGPTRPAPRQVPTNPQTPPPPAPTPPPEPQHVFTSVKMIPDTATMEQGAILIVEAVAIDQSGLAIGNSFANTFFSSSDTTIARVGTFGNVTAIAIGSASISAVKTMGGISRSSTMSVTIKPATPLDTVVFNSGTKGWLPIEAHLAAGGIVWWVAPPINWSGSQNTRVFLLDPETYATLDSVDLIGGRGSRKFTTPGAVIFCSGGCWDPPDWGAIYVH